MRLALTIAALNDMEAKVGDVLNAYITSPITEKVWTILGPEFGPDAGKSALIVRALYGLKSAGAAFRAHLASFMRQMGYTSCKARGSSGSSPALFFLFFPTLKNEQKDFKHTNREIRDGQRTDHNTIPPNRNIGNIGLRVVVNHDRNTYAHTSPELAMSTQAAR